MQARFDKGLNLDISLMGATEIKQESKNAGSAANYVSLYTLSQARGLHSKGGA